MELNRRVSPQWISREAVARSVLKFNVCLVTDEQELDQFLGKLISKVSRTAGSIIRSSAGKALGGILKGAAKKALPIAGPAVGTYFGGPAGGAIGGKLASAAGRIFGLELEGMSGEDQEFEVARRFVRLAASAAQKAAAARSAVAAAARRHAPGLLSPSVGGTLSTAYGRRSGALGSLGSPRTQDHRARRLRREPDTRTLREERECTTSIQHKGGEPSGLEAPEPESFEYNFEQEQEMDFETGSPFGEIEETELAEGLLAVQS